MKDSTNFWLTKMRESTGSHFMDSGGGSGRHWQRNQAKTDEQLLENKIDIWLNEDKTRIDVTPIISIAHVLKGFHPCDELTNKFRDYYNSLPDNDMTSEFSAIRDWVTDVLEAGEIHVCNTYNDDNLLSQAIQYVRFDTGDDVCWAIQIHQGADIRGGYTDTVICTSDYEDYLQYQTANIRCPQCKFSVYTYDAGRTYEDYSDGNPVITTSLDWLRYYVESENTVCCLDCKVPLIAEY
jgi:hypothetical protein